MTTGKYALSRLRDDSDETQAADALAVIRGERPLAIIELRKAPETYNILWAADCYADLWTTGGRAAALTPRAERNAFADLRNGSEGFEIVLSRGDYFARYTDLLARRDAYTRHHFQIALGELLGYDRADCERFARNPVDCDCSKCGGPETQRDRLEREAWIKRTDDEVYR